MTTLTNNVYAKEVTDLLGIGVTLNADGSVASVDGPTIRRVTADPSGVVTANAGSLALRSNGLLYVSGGGTTWSQAASTAAGDLVTMRAALTTPGTDFAANTNTQQKFTAFQPTLAVATLTAGTVIRVRVSGTINNATAANVTLNIYGNDALTGLLASIALNNPVNGANFLIDTTATLRTATTVSYSQFSVITTTAGTLNANTTPFLAGQGGAITLTAQWSAADAGNNVDIEQFVVEIATN